MDARRKPIPNPIERGRASRALAPVSGRSRLPTVAALLALGALGCQEPTREAISGDVTVSHAMSATNDGLHEGIPRAFSPADPLPGMGALEEPSPSPEPSVVVPPPPPPHKPYPVKGGAKAVYPKPLPPPMAGGLKPAMPPPTPPIAPPKKAPRPGGDMPAVWPETT